MTTKPETNYFDEGKQAAVAYYSSQGFAGLSRSISAEDAAKLFLPNLNESMMTIATPYPKPRQKWLAGFKKGQAEILTK